jgi:4'-phosphopantetheinyl transferase
VNADTPPEPDIAGSLTAGTVDVWTAPRTGALDDQDLVRDILAGYAGGRAEGLSIARTEHGKPFLPDHPELCFNLSHSGDTLALAVTRGADVGVDIELVKPMQRFGGVAARFLAPSEHHALERLPEERQLEAFYACWTAKEAFVKALGTGLKTPLRSFEVDTSEPGRPRLVTAPEGAGEPGEWAFAALSLPREMAAAVALRGPLVRLRVMAWARPA